VSTPPIRWHRTAALLTDAMRSTGESRARVARAIGIGRQQVGRWALGRATPRRHCWEPLAEALGIEVDAIRAAVTADHDEGAEHSGPKPGATRSEMAQAARDAVYARGVLRVAADRLGVDRSLDLPALARAITRAVCRGEM